MSRCPFPVSSPQPGAEAEKGWNPPESSCRPGGSMGMGGCAYLIHLVRGGVFANSDGECGLVGHSYSQLHIWHAVVVLGCQQRRKALWWENQQIKARCSTLGSAYLIWVRQELLHDVTFSDDPYWAHCKEKRWCFYKAKSILFRLYNKLTQALSWPFSRYSSRPLRRASSCCSDIENGHFPGSLGNAKLSNSLFRFWCRITNSR